MTYRIRYNEHLNVYRLQYKKWSWFPFWFTVKDGKGLYMIWSSEPEVRRYFNKLIDQDNSWKTVIDGMKNKRLSPHNVTTTQ